MQASSPPKHPCFYADENLDLRIVQSLLKYGIPVTTAADLGLLGEKDDTIHLAKAAELGCILITNDQDFGRINKQWLAEGKSHAGIILLSSVRRRSPGELVKKLIEFYEAKRPDDMVNLFQPI